MGEVAIGGQEAGTQLVRCQGIGKNVAKGRLTAILPHMAESVNANDHCPVCSKAYNDSRPQAADGGLVAHDRDSKILSFYKTIQPSYRGVGNNGAVRGKIRADILANKLTADEPELSDTKFVLKFITSKGWFEAQSAAGVIEKPAPLVNSIANQLFGIQPTEPLTFDKLPFWKKGTKTGAKGRERPLVPNMKERKEILEAHVNGLAEEKYNPAEGYVVVDNTKNSGFDFLIYFYGKLIAMWDAKSSPVVSRRQWKNAKKAIKNGVEVWLVGRERRKQITSKSRISWTQAKVID